MRQATSDEIAETLSFALVHKGRRRVRDAERMMARIKAQRLVRHLERSGFVVMKKAPAAAHSASAIMPPPGAAYPRCRLSLNGPDGVGSDSPGRNYRERRPSVVRGHSGR
jgi:hypothetical protein